MGKEIKCLKEIVEWFEYNRDHTIYMKCWHCGEGGEAEESFDCHNCLAETYFEKSFDDIDIPDCIVDAKRLIQLDKEK